MTILDEAERTKRIEGCLRKAVDLFDEFGDGADLADVMTEHVDAWRRLLEDPFTPSFLAWKDGDDRPLPEDDHIHDAFPTRSGDHEKYGEAMRLVGARYSKGGLVALVNWLLHRIEAERTAGAKRCTGATPQAGEGQEKKP